ncbi:MAG TPA: PKD domain-containing protein, partial [Anaerolineales bacterium]
TPTCIGLTCAFADQSSDTRPIISRTWDFGDGTGSNDLNPEHTYARGGSFTVRLTVQDEAGARGSSAQAVALEDAVVFVGAGDISGCNSRNQDAATADLIKALPTAQVFALGDNAYPDGSAADYACYQATWGAFKDRTHPVPGNHDYHQGAAAQYFAYFGAAAGRPGLGYYSYDLGTWHILALNSESTGKEQLAWLQADLSAHPSTCVLAYWHQPFFTSGAVHDPDPAMRPIWDALQAASAEVVLSGHNHQYERFAPQLSDGTASELGMRQFVVGTGGFHSLYDFITPPKANSEARYRGFGVLKLTLGTTGYSWEFLPIPGSHYTDTGSAVCH